ncbi:MAG: hypothetical protein CMN30_15805 [Sandaracinus sp.]|nr:hypothetical protein [Sandaracinus sp.]
MNNAEILLALAFVDAALALLVMLAILSVAVSAARIAKDTAAIRESARRAADAALQVQHRLSQ